MKNALNFNIQFSNLLNHSFPNCFAGVYVYLENIFNELPKKCGEGETWCFGCACKAHPDPQSVYLALFDTMCGRNSLYWRFDGVMTEIAELIGDASGIGNWSGKCGTDYTIDFLFGFAGYEYRKINNAAMFKDEIAASIDSSKPVLAELAADGSEFCVITGYDGDTLVSSYYVTDQDNNTQEKCTITLSNDEIKTIYIIGNKVTPRYTLKDGLGRIKLIIESSFSEKTWDDGIDQINNILVHPTDDEFKETNADELAAFRNRFTETLTNQFNSHIYEMALCHLPKVYDEAQHPALLDLWNELSRCISRLNNYAFAAGNFNKVNISRIGLFRTGFGKMFMSAVEDIKNTHLEMLKIINQAIDILDKK